MEICNEGKNSFFKLDPRTKLLIVIMISIFVFAGLFPGHRYIHPIRIILVSIPFILLVFEKMYKGVFIFSLGFFVSYGLQLLVLNHTRGIVNFMLLFSIGMFVRVIPGLLAFKYLIHTTTISELIYSLKKIKLSDKFIIPLAVMFRFFPTVIEESRCVSNSMKMRGIYFGGKKISKMLEYRLIPMITCSVKAGDELSMSALSRGLGSPNKRSSICESSFGILDYILHLLFLFIILLLIFS